MYYVQRVVFCGRWRIICVMFWVGRMNMGMDMLLLMLSMEMVELLLLVLVLRFKMVIRVATKNEDLLDDRNVQRFCNTFDDDKSISCPIYDLCALPKGGYCYCYCLPISDKEFGINCSILMRYDTTGLQLECNINTASIRWTTSRMHRYRYRYMEME